MLLIETSYLKFSLEQSWKIKSGKWASLERHQEMTAQGPVGCITAMSIIKLKREPLLKSKALTLRGTACACPSVQSEICMHLSFLGRWCHYRALCFQTPLLSERPALTNWVMEFMLQGVASEAKLSNSSFNFDGFSLYSLHSYSQYRSDSLKQMLDLQKCSDPPIPYWEREVVTMDSLHKNRCVPVCWVLTMLLFVHLRFFKSRTDWSWIAWVGLLWFWIPPVSPLPTSIEDTGDKQSQRSEFSLLLGIEISFPPLLVLGHVSDW